jgi:hypothetical protein
MVKFKYNQNINNMKELFEIEGQSIFTFKVGDIIIQVKPAEMKRDIHNDNLGITIQITEGIDNSYRKNPVIFRGIYNNLIYLEDIKKSFDGKIRISKAPIETHSENWALFQVPEGLSLDEC